MTFSPRLLTWSPAANPSKLLQCRRAASREGCSRTSPPLEGPKRSYAAAGTAKLSRGKVLGGSEIVVGSRGTSANRDCGEGGASMIRLAALLAFVVGGCS